MRRANTGSGFFLHELFDDSVFQGVISDDYQPAFVAEQVNGLPQGCLQVLEFMVYGYPQGLECLGGRVDFTSSADGFLD
jgi:hypothetical protein